MDAAAELIEVRNDVLRKIGRNVVRFQELEGILKFLVVSLGPAAPASGLQTQLEKRIASVTTHTLGQLNRHLLEDLYRPSDADSFASAQITEPWFTLMLHIEADAASVEASKASLTALVKERNELVHGLLTRWKLHDASSCQALSVELEAQHGRILLEIDRYRAYADGLRDFLREYQEFLDSEEGKKQLDLVCLQQSRLVMMLERIAKEHAREDGWTLLSIAGHCLNQLIPEEFIRLKRAYGDGSLHKLIAATCLFDICIEATANGGTRTIYRSVQ